MVQDIKGADVLDEARQHGTGGNAELRDDPQTTWEWSQGTTMTDNVELFGDFEAVPTGVDSEFAAWEALSDEAFDLWERMRKQGDAV